MMMPDRKKAFEILIIVIGGAYLLYRIFAPKMDTKDTAVGFSGAADYTSAGPEMAGLREAVDRAAQSDRKLKDKIGNSRNIFQKPNEFFATDTEIESAAASETQNIALSFEGIVWGQGKKVAILSGMVVAEGDVIKGWKVVRIEPDRVVIFKNGVESEIKRGA